MTKVIACTPTRDRRWSWEFSKACMLGQKQKPDLWVVLDNSSSPAYDWAPAKDFPGVLYERVYEQKTIGALRNRCLEIALEQGADYIVFWDDDDYYPPTRISTGVGALEKNPDADISASSKMYILLTRENVLMTVGPYGEKHGTAATHTIRRRYAEAHRFHDKARGEELEFTNHWTANLIQVPAEEMIVVMGHSKNTVDKSDILKRPQVYRGAVFNSDNGRMAVRARWPVPWEVFRSTFLSGERV
jgi:glycosyltransferase involved in cell wall biosynthesis